MNARTEFVAPPYVAGMQRVDSYADIDEILRSEDFVQGSHRESGVFFNGSLLLSEGHAHMQRRQLFSSLVSRSAMQYYETGALAPVFRSRNAIRPATSHGSVLQRGMSIQAPT